MSLVFATTADLENFTGQTAPADATRLLKRASEAISDALLTAVYATDAEGYPSNAAEREAVREATCAVVEWWSEDRGTGDETGAQSSWTSVTAGAVSLSRSGGSGGASGSTAIGPGRLPPRARGFLQRAGLLPGTVYQR